MERFWLWLCRFAFRRLRAGGRFPDGIPTVRDVNAPCAAYAPRPERAGDFTDCMGDGHYLCGECAHLSPARRCEDVIAGIVGES